MLHHFPFLSFPIFLLGSTATVANAQEPTPDQAPQARRDRLHEAGVAAPLWLFPVRVLGRADANVADALGLVLERRGMSDLQVAAVPFDAKELPWTAIPAAFGAHVRAQAQQPAKSGKEESAKARYALYTEFLGDPQQGPKEVRFVVVDAAGEVVLVDRQTPVDPAFRRTAGRDPDPLGCSALVGERLFELAGWKQVAGGVRDGAFAAKWQQKSGAPDKNERAAMSKRLAVLRDSIDGHSIAVFPPLWASADEVDAERLARVVQSELECKAAMAVANGSLSVAPSSNQQQRLYGLAAAVKTAIGKQPIEADYALALDVGLAPNGKSGFVNVVVLTRAGELVLADFQNDQHPMFQERAPKTLVEAEQLAIARLRQLLR